MSKQVLDIFTGTANPELANEVADILGKKYQKQMLVISLMVKLKFKSRTMSEVMILSYFSRLVHLQTRI
jgi:hypothetical protein